MDRWRGWGLAALWAFLYPRTGTGGAARAPNWKPPRLCAADGAHFFLGSGGLTRRRRAIAGVWRSSLFASVLQTASKFFFAIFAGSQLTAVKAGRRNKSAPLACSAASCSNDDARPAGPGCGRRAARLADAADALILVQTAKSCLSVAARRYQTAGRCAARRRGARGAAPQAQPRRAASTCAPARGRQGRPARPAC